MQVRSHSAEKARRAKGENDETRMKNNELNHPSPFELRGSSFIRHSDFVIRISFRIRHGH